MRITDSNIAGQRRDLIRRGLALAGASAWPGLVGSHEAFDTGRILVGFPAGGTTDAVSRRIAEQLRPAYAKTMLVENKPGVGGRLGVQALMRSPNDGSTLLLTPASILTLSPHVYRHSGFNLFDDLTPVCSACATTFALGVGPAVPASVQSLRDFLTWAQSNADRANVGSPATGSAPHLLGAMLGQAAGVALRHIAYRGAGPGMQDLMGGQIAAFTSPVGDYLPHIQTGRLRVLATSGPQRSRFLPQAPTFKELGYADLTFVEWYGLFLPARAAPDITARAAAAVQAAMAATDMARGLSQWGLEVATNSPAELARAVRDEYTAWGAIVQRVGFTPES